MLTTYIARATYVQEKSSENKHKKIVPNKNGYVGIALDYLRTLVPIISTFSNFGSNVSQTTVIPVLSQPN